jgi:membrane associated rhomboid family serine protease
MHVLGNMWFLWIFGDNIEDILGHGKYILFYLLCGVVAALAQVAVSPNSRIPTVGASGAIAGIMGAYMIKFPHSRILSLVTIVFFFTTVEIPAWIMLIYWFVIQFFSGVGTLGSSQVSQGGVAFFAHIGGFIAGIVLISVMGARQPYSSRRETDW